MADQPTLPPPAEGTNPPTTGAMTREQQRRATEENNAIEDSEKNSADEPRKKGKEKETFKGKVEKMGGNVFQLAEEGRKGNQFTQTLEALKNYVAIEMDHAKDLAPLLESPSRAATLTEPSDLPPTGADGINRVTRDHRLYIAWKFECESYNSRAVALEANQLKLFTVILMQCSQSVKLKLEATAGYEKAKAGSDCLWVLTTLKNICHRFEHTENRFLALVNAKAAIFNYKQAPEQSTTDYFESFKELVSVLESYGGKLHDPQEAAPESADIENLANEAEKETFMRTRYCAMLFLRNADKQRFEQLRKDLSNDFSKGRDEYPTSLTDAHQLLLTYKASEPTKRNDRGGRGGRTEGGRSDGGRGDRTKAGYRGRGGKTGRNFVQNAFSLAQIENHFPNGIPEHYVLLDSDSTVSIFRSQDLLTDIHEVDNPLYLETNGGGYQVSNKMGTVKNLGKVWYNPESIANVLSLAQVRRIRRVTMDTADQPAFHVHKADGTGTTVFAEHESGLYLHDTSIPADNASPVVIAYSHLQTVAGNKEGFTRRQIELADEARKLYHMMGRPGMDRFLEALKKNHIINCPITVDDAKRAESIYGKDVAFLKGKMTSSPAKDHLPDYQAVALPPELLSLQPKVTLCFDIFYVLDLTFSLSTSRNIRYLSCRPMADRNKGTIKACIAADLKMYRERGFEPAEIHADGEYNALKNSFGNVHFSICSADDHVPEAERAIRTVKETIRATIHGMPYKRLPRVMVRDLAEFAVRAINMVPSADGVSDSMSPETIVTGKPKVDYRTMKLEFGTYVQVYDGTSNDTKSRTLGAIALNSTGNSNGDYFFMSLATGRRIHRRSWTVLPISEIAISRVEAIAIEEGMPAVDRDCMINEYDPDEIVDESAYDKDYQLPNTPDRDSDHELTTDAYTDSDESDGSDSDEENDDVGHHSAYDDEAERSEPYGQPAGTKVASDVEPKANSTLTQPTGPVTEPEAEMPEQAGEEQHAEKEERTSKEERAKNNTDPSIEQHAEKEERTSQEERAKNDAGLPDEPEERGGPPSRRKGLRKKKDPSYQHRFGFTQTDGDKGARVTWKDMQPAIAAAAAQQHEEGAPEATQTQAVRKAIFGLIFTQMSAKSGIKKHGQAAVDALRKEFEQFRSMDVLEPLDAFKLTEEQKAESLRALSVIKEKRNGLLKGRTVADGSSQKGKYPKEQTGSPTISNDALFMTILIDAHENRDVATADITGAYLHAHMKDFVTIRFTGWAVDLLCEVNREYEKHVVFEGKTKVLYVRCNKAIYGCVMSGLLWYELFSSTLQEKGFAINPYDFCVANATIEGSQCTIGWFVDDTKISHVKTEVVSEIIGLLESRFGKMTVTRGTHHAFLGMQIEYHGDGTASIHMPSYIQEAIDESGLQVNTDSPSPCSGTLFKIDPDSPPLGRKRAQTFHSVVAKLIYVGTRTRTDILLALGFLCSRVSSPTEQDEKKLKRLLEYLRGTKEMPLRLGADSLDRFMTWVDASFAVHSDMRSHTGGVISFGRGGIICKSKKQNINTKSSTEAELIGASDYLPHTLYVKMFMEAQGYPIAKAVFYQDNESAIKMERNGKASCGQRSRHIDIRYFFITDHSKNRNIDIAHCPTTDMLADFFTKPLQGSLFRKFRSVLLGHAHVNTLRAHDPQKANEERVGSENCEPTAPGRDASVTPGLGVTHHATYGVTNAGANASAGSNSETGSKGYRANGGETSISNTAHSIEKYPED